MTESSQSKAIIAAESLSKWVKDREASGDLKSYIRAGKLNKTTVASELGFTRSAFQTNPRLAEIADRLDRKFGGSKSTNSSQASKTMKDYIERYEAGNQPIPNQKGSLHLAQIIEESGISQINFANDSSIREMLSDYADIKGMSLSLPGFVAPQEDNRGKVSSDPSEMVPVKKLRDAQQRVSQLEKKVADLRTSNAALRAKDLQNKEFEELIAAGGRVAPSDKNYEDVVAQLAPLFPSI